MNRLRSAMAPLPEGLPLPLTDADVAKERKEQNDSREKRGAAHAADARACRPMACGGSSAAEATRRCNAERRIALRAAMEAGDDMEGTGGAGCGGGIRVVEGEVVSLLPLVD
jgi:hypothetical protein